VVVGLLWILGGCGAPPAPAVVCPEDATLQESAPVTGGRTVWCQRRNDTRHGPWIEYREDGSVWRRGQYEHNRKTGVFTLYWPNGNQREVAIYVEGELDGPKTEWDESGQKVREETWIKGVLVTPQASP
jgi:hypothetical protein